MLGPAFNNFCAEDPRFLRAILFGIALSITGVFLRKTLKISDGNLSVEIRRLEEAGCINVERILVDHKPKTFCKITGRGRRLYKI